MGLPDFGRVKKEYAKKVSKEIFAHNLRCVKVAEGLARRFGADVEKAKMAALVHDIAWEIGADGLRRLARENGIKVGMVEESAPILLHGPVGAVLIKRELKIDDDGIAAAVRWHTTGRGGMSLLEKITLLADKIEAGSSVGNRKAIVRKLDGGKAGGSLAAAILEFMDGNLVFQVRQGWMVHPKFVEARNALIAELEGKEF